jgi:hypothetical protein
MIMDEENAFSVRDHLEQLQPSDRQLTVRSPREAAYDRALQFEDHWCGFGWLVTRWWCSDACRTERPHGRGRYGCPQGPLPDYRGWRLWYEAQCAGDPERGGERPAPAPVEEPGSWWSRPEHRALLADYPRAFAEVLVAEEAVEPDGEDEFLWRLAAEDD